MTEAFQSRSCRSWNGSPRLRAWGFSAANIEVEASSRDEVAARVVDEDLFERAIEELIENAVIHSAQGTPSVVVRT